MTAEEQTSVLKKGEKAAWFSTLVVFLAFITELLVGYFSGSLILISDAIHNASDSAAGITSWFGLKIAQKQSDERFPYGYYKAESLATFFISVFIFYAAFELLREGYSTLWVVPSLIYPVPALAIAIVLTVLSFVLSRYLKNIGTEIKSQSLIANAKEKKTDIYSSLVTFFGVLSTYFHIPYVTGVITILFSLIAFKVAFSTTKNAVLTLMDISPGKDIEAKVKKILDSITGVQAYDNLKCRKAGPFIFGEVEVKVQKDYDVKRAHEIAHTIENTVKEQVKRVDSLTVHVEPYENEERKIALPIVENNALQSRIMDHFGRTRYFIFVKVNKEKGSILTFSVKENPFTLEEVHAGFEAAEYLVEKENITTLITKEIGGIAYHTLKSHLIDIYQADDPIVEKVVNKFLKNQLKPLEAATKEAGLKPSDEMQRKMFSDQPRRHRRGSESKKKE